jgi:hypothetical protein
MDLGSRALSTISAPRVKHALTAERLDRLANSDRRGAQKGMINKTGPMTEYSWRLWWNK